MRVKIVGDCEAARALRGHLLEHSNVAVVQALPDLTVTLRLIDAEGPILDANGTHEAVFACHLREGLGKISYVRPRKEGRDVVSVGIPRGKEAQAARALFRAVAGDVAKTKRGWWLRRLFAVAALILLPSLANAQATNIALMKCHNGTISFWCSDAATTSLRTRLVASDVSLGSYVPDITGTGTISATCAAPCPTSTATANSTVAIELLGRTALSFVITASTWAGTLSCQSSIDGENWDFNNCADFTITGTATRGITITNPAAQNTYNVSVYAGQRWFRLRGATGSGSVSILLNGTADNSYQAMWAASTYAGVQVPQRMVYTGNTDASTTCNSTGCMVPDISKNTVPLATDYGKFVRLVPQDSFATGTLTTNCASTCDGANQAGTIEIALAGSSVPAIEMLASSGTITIAYETSIDHNKWTAVQSLDSSTFVRASSTVNPTGAIKKYIPMLLGGERYLRVHCTSVSGGSAQYNLSQTYVPFSPWLSQTVTGTPGPSVIHVVGGSDGTNARTFNLLNTTPVGSEYGLIVRSTDGKAEDAAHTSGDVGSQTLLVRKDGNAQTTSADGDYAFQAGDAYSVAYVRMDHPNRISCNADNIAATLTQLTNCGAPGASLSIYITDIIAQSTTATGGAFTLKSGTTGNCGATVAFLYPPVAGTAFAPANTNTTGPFQIHFMTPIKVTANNMVCVLGVATNTTNIMVNGYIAP